MRNAIALAADRLHATVDHELTAAGQTVAAAPADVDDLAAVGRLAELALSGTAFVA